MGIVLPGGLNMYYLDVAPNTEGTMHRTTSTDYLVVISGRLSLMTTGTEAYSVKDGKGTYREAVETVCHAGEVVAQRGMMHAYDLIFPSPLGC
jgi:hydroxyethylthiazole kinase-like sugar kinase family protein